IDLMRMKAIVWHDEAIGSKFDVIDIPPDFLDEAQEMHDYMVERVAEFDESLTTKFLEGKTITADELKKALRHGTITLKGVPVICGAAFKNKGVQPMLDAVVDYLPSPLDI